MANNDGTARLKIAIQGQPASFHDVAARKFFGDNIDVICCDLPFSRVFDELISQRADFAVCAIENSLYGTIPEVYDLLLKHRTWISGEVTLQIHQCLVGLEGTKLNEIKEVYSHPVALAQCEVFLDDNLPEASRFSDDDTAGSAAKVSQWKEKSKVAIASEAAASMYGLTVIRRGIETDRQNFTRFAILGRNIQHPVTANKLSLVVTTSHKPGALYDVLGVFAAKQLNLVLLVSRPIIGQPGRYSFYIDVQSTLDETGVQQVIKELEMLGNEIVILGHYRSTGGLR